MSRQSGRGYWSAIELCISAGWTGVPVNYRALYLGRPDGGTGQLQSSVSRQGGRGYRSAIELCISAGWTGYRSAIELCISAGRTGVLVSYRALYLGRVDGGTGQLQSSVSGQVGRGYRSAIELCISAGWTEVPVSYRALYLGRVDGGTGQL